MKVIYENDYFFNDSNDPTSKVKTYILFNLLYLQSNISDERYLKYNQIYWI